MTDNGWISAGTLPTKEESGGFGVVEVIMQCNPASGSGPWQVMRLARPVFIGGDANRVLWLNAENKSGEPIENASWWVTHWRPFPAFPKPV